MARSPRGALAPLTVLLLASFAVAGCGLLPRQGVVARPLNTLPLPATQKVATVTVAQGTVTNTVQIAGTVAPLQTAQLYFTTGGTVKTLNIINDQIVQKGDVLATLDSGNIAFQLSQMALTLQRDQLQIQDVESSLQTSPPTSTAAAEKRMSQVAQAQLQLNTDQLQQQNLQLQMAEYQIVAPYAGKVTNVSVHLQDSVGQYQVIAQLEDIEGDSFVAQLTPAQANIVSPGQPVKLTLASDPQAALTSTINSIQIPSTQASAIAQANPGVGGLTQPQATLNTPTGYTFKPSDVGGAFTALVTVAEVDNALYLPATHVVFSFNGLDYVFLYKAGRTIERPVSLGLQGNTDIVITGGLNVGDTVIEQQ